jgi:hypothetical protein
MDFLTNTPLDLGFIILRNVIDKTTGEYWKLSYKCIRKFYPNNYIIIIDDNSNYDFVDLKFQENLYNAHIIRSDYPARGELLPYYYFLKSNIFEKACFIHDSVFINSKLDTEITDYKFLWNFNSPATDFFSSFGNIIQEKMRIDVTQIISALDNSDELIHFFKNNKDWKACLGSMSIITHKYLEEINNRYSLERLLPIIKSRRERIFFEAIFACMLQYRHIQPSLFGDIKKFSKWNLTYNDIQKDIHDLSKINLPLIKVWTGR